VVANVICSLTNMYQSLALDKVKDVIAKFVGFKLLIQI